MCLCALGVFFFPALIFFPSGLIFYFWACLVGLNHQNKVESQFWTVFRIVKTHSEVFLLSVAIFLFLTIGGARHTSRKYFSSYQIWNPAVLCFLLFLRLSYRQHSFGRLCIPQLKDLNTWVPVSRLRKRTKPPKRDTGSRAAAGDERKRLESQSPAKRRAMY